MVRIRRSHLGFGEEIATKLGPHSRKGLAFKVETGKVNMTVCVGPKLSAHTRGMLGLDGDRPIHIEGTLRDGRQFVINDPGGSGRLSKGGFFGIDADTAEHSIEEYLGAGPEDFYADIQHQIRRYITSS